MQPATATATDQPLPKGYIPEPTEDEGFIFETPSAPPFSTFCVVYVGDIVPDLHKKAPIFRLGGKLFNWEDYKTVPNYIVEQCAITKLKPAMRQVHRTHIPPEQHAMWTKSYTHTNLWDKNQRKFVNKLIGASPAEKFFLYKKLDQWVELKTIVGGGVVHISDEAGLISQEAIRAAQYHYFPNWLEIRTGQAKQPELLRQLEEHIENRRAITTSPAWKALGDAYLQSVDQFREWAAEYIAFQTAVIDEVKAKGITVRYDAIAERLFKFVELTREDKMVQGFAAQQNDSAGTNKQIAEAITVLTALVARQSAGAAQGVGRPENQPPVPTTQAEAAAEMDRQITDEAEFTDMSQAVISDEDAMKLIDEEIQQEGGETI